MSAPRHRWRRQEPEPGRPPRSHRSNGPARPRSDEAAGFAEYLLAQIGRLDTRPGTLAAMQRGLDEAWDVLGQAAPQQEGDGDEH